MAHYLTLHGTAVGYGNSFGTAGTPLTAEAILEDSDEFGKKFNAHRCIRVLATKENVAQISQLLTELTRALVRGDEE